MNALPLLRLHGNSSLATASELIELLGKLQHEDLSRVVRRVSKVHGLPMARAFHCRDQFLRFFALCSHFGASLAPDQASDDFWHEFLLFTQDYASFCQRYLGYFLHHCPFDDETAASTIAATLDAATLIKQHFVEVQPELIHSSVICARA